MLRNNVSQNFDVAQHCADAFWSWHIRWVLHSCALFSQVMTERYREQVHEEKQARWTRWTGLCLWWIRTVRICPNSVDLSGRPQLFCRNPVWFSKSPGPKKEWPDHYKSQIDGNINGTYMQCRCLQGSGKAPQRCHWAGCWWLSWRFDQEQTPQFKIWIMTFNDMQWHSMTFNDIQYHLMKFNDISVHWWQDIGFF